MRHATVILLIYSTICGAQPIKNNNQDCWYEHRKITGFHLSKNKMTLSYVTDDGKKNILATAESGGTLRGIFQGSIQRNDDISTPWVDVRDAKHLRGDKFQQRAFYLYYLPMRHKIQPSDLGLKNEWTIFDFRLDYHREENAFSEKEFQIYAKSKTGKTRSFLAADIEKLLLTQCNLSLGDLPQKYTFR